MTPFHDSDRALASTRLEAGLQNVLVVDDDESVRELMALVLEAEGYTVVRARHSREALYLHEEFPGTFHVLLTDICMGPHANGFTLAREVRRDRPDIRVIYASGFVDHNELQAELEASPSSFLAKPFTPASLVACVRESLLASVQA